MPVVGYLARQSTVIESDPLSGTFYVDMYYQVTPSVYRTGTIQASTGGTVVGSIVGAIINLRKLYQLDSVGIIGVAEDTLSVVGARVVGYGKALGSLIGTTVAATVVAGTNTVLVQFYKTGTLSGTLSSSTANPVLITPGSTIVGTINVLERGA